MVKYIKLTFIFISFIYSVFGVTFAASLSEARGYLDAHRLLKLDFNNSQNSLKLFRETKSYIEAVGAENLLTTSSGKELLARQKKLRSAFSIKNHLSNCGESRRNLGERLTNAAMSASHCELMDGIEDEPVFDTQKNIQRVINRDIASLKQIKSAGYQDVIINSAMTIWEYDRVFNENKHDKISDYVEEFCDLIDKKNCKDIVLYRKLAEARRNFEAAASLKDSVDLSNLKDQFNSNIGKLNDSLGLIEDKESLASQIGFAAYQSQYQQLLSSGVGSLLLTKSLGEKVGGLKSFDDLEEVERSRYQRRHGVPKSFKMPQHSSDLKVEDLQGAYRELRAETLEGLEDVHEDFEDEDTEEFLRRLMMTHPASLGTTLIKHPHMSGLICELIGDIESSDRFWSGFKKVAVVGGIILGTAAAITVVGSGVAAALYTASAAAATGTAATALAASASKALLIGGIATGVGFAVGASETALWAYEVNRTQEEAEKLRLALMAKTTDSQGVEEVQKLMNEHESAMQKAMISGAFTALDVLAYTKLARMAGELAQATGARTMGRMSGTVNQMVDLMKSNPKIKSLISFMGNFFKNSDGAFGKLMGKLSGMKEGVMRKFLINMSELSEEEVEKILRRMFSCG